ncbi:hypothetical protein ATE84_2489 [Aquimarina sp. MAR_2010_214]|uniref:hypothetical protein n=1 Tax=Aquimarina sp. MAR_2010_214 TaxID=1250026 RepID=UPI000C6FDA00|nr:hypothetical protein [Aquimarina sp. MAR_2010_214]PKV50432.1 hypothetical protein ATE84_2489 [Aquimarina sp. MAR_2010_214]
MKFYKIITYLCIVLLNYSCATLKKNEIIENKVELTRENLNLIDGTYKIDENKYLSYSDYFLGSFCTNKESKLVYKIRKKSGIEPLFFITLSVLNKNKIKAKLKINNSVLKTYTIRGKIKNGYFEQNRKGYILPALLINEFQSYKFRIGLLNDGNIITDSKKVDFGTVYFFSPFNNSGSNYNLRHNRILNLKK